MTVNDHRYRSLHKFKMNGCINYKITQSILLGVNRKLYSRTHKIIHIENTVVYIDNTQGRCIILFLLHCWLNRGKFVDEFNEWVRCRFLISYIQYKKGLVILPTRELAKHLSNLDEYKAYNQLLPCCNCSTVVIFGMPRILMTCVGSLCRGWIPFSKCRSACMSHGNDEPVIITEYDRAIF